MFFSKILYPLLSTGSTQEDRKMSRHYLKIVDWGVKHQHKQTNITLAIPVYMYFFFCRLRAPKIILQTLSSVNST